VPRKRRKKRRRPSNGVKKIIQYLDDHNIIYKREHRFVDCRNKLPLPFDFVIFKNNQIVCLIEYNGIQHYSPIRKFGGKKALKQQQIHDLIKQNYCVANNFNLIVIHYEDEDKIDEILSSILYN
jgi:hypothetical protein